jgi:hypothetical protein
MQDFNSFIQSLLSNPNPQGGMMGGGGNQPNRQFYDQAGNDAYYQNPYRMQDSIDAGMLKRKEADAAMAAAMGQQMPQTNGGGGGGDFGMQLSPDQIAFLDAETLDERGARIQNDFAKLFNPIPSLVGMLSGPTREGPNAPVVDSSSYSAAAKAEQARQQEFNNSLMVSENSKRAAAQVAQQQQAAQQEAAAQAAIQSQAQAYFAAQNTSSGNNSNDSYGGYGGFSGSDAGGGGFGPSSAGGM